MTEADRRKTWYALFLFVLLVSTILILKAAECSRQNIERKLYAERQLALRNLRKDNSFDILIFTQHWPITVCAKWIEQNKKHECDLPKQKNAWEIHGIWPTKYHEIGPLFCNDSYPFDMKAIEPILDEMKEKWINIEKGTPLDGLWKHEWEKHGTCAAANIKDLNTQLKYFSEGLTLLDRYSIDKLLQSTYIKPGIDIGYKLDEIFTTLNSSIGNNFAIVCERDHKTKQQYLFEIRICFDKELNIHSCDGIVMEDFFDSNYSDKIITNCDKNSEIFYPSRAWIQQKQWLARIEEQQVKSDSFLYHWINIYKFIRLLQWVTL